MARISRVFNLKVRRSVYNSLVLYLTPCKGANLSFGLNVEQQLYSIGYNVVECEETLANVTLATLE